MKKLILQSLFLLLLTNVLNAQQLTVKETEALEKQADQEKIKGKEYLMEFILKRDTNLFNLGTNALKECEVKYKRVLKEGTANSYMAGAISSIISAKISLVSSDLLLYGKYFRKDLLKETEENWKKKIKFNDVEYRISAESKKNYNSLKESIKSESKL